MAVQELPLQCVSCPLHHCLFCCITERSGRKHIARRLQAEVFQHQSFTYEQVWPSYHTGAGKLSKEWISYSKKQNGGYSWNKTWSLSMKTESVGVCIGEIGESYENYSWQWNSRFFISFRTLHETEHRFANLMWYGSMKKASTFLPVRRKCWITVQQMVLLHKPAWSCR